MKDESLTMSVTECAKHLGIGRNSAYDGVKRGEIPCIRVGKRLLVPRAALERMLTHISEKTYDPEVI